MSSTNNSNTVAPDRGPFTNSSFFRDATVFYSVLLFGVALLILTAFLPNSTVKNSSINVVLMALLIYILMYVFFTPTPIPNSEKIKKIKTQMQTFFRDDFNLIWTIVSLLVLYLIMYLMGSNTITGTGSKPFAFAMIETALFITVFLFVLNIFFNTALGVPLFDILFEAIDKLLASLFGSATEEIKTKDTEEKTSPDAEKNEVFNISNNLYTFDEAAAVCKTYGARLANYNQIESAYEQGAEFCNYGWSEGQMAFFPTQKETWKKIQQESGKESSNKCGRPGVNGGYFDNPKLMFGVNCYGVKPAASDEDQLRMKNQKLATSQISDNEKVNLLKNHSDKTMVISSYNNNLWSKY